MCVECDVKEVFHLFLAHFDIWRDHGGGLEKSKLKYPAGERVGLISTKSVAFYNRQDHFEVDSPLPKK